MMETYMKRKCQAFYVYSLLVVLHPIYTSPKNVRELVFGSFRGYIKTIFNQDICRSEKSNMRMESLTNNLVRESLEGFKKRNKSQEEGV